MSSAQTRALGGCVYVLGKQLQGRGWQVAIEGDPQKDAVVSFSLEANGKSIEVASGKNPMEGLRLTVDGKTEKLRQLRYDRAQNAIVGPNGQDGVRFLLGRLERLLGAKAPSAT